jgi:L-ribulokinase
MRSFSLGVDFGTESARALLLDTASGNEAAVAVCRYPHGVMDRALPSGEPLPPLWALQHPADYLEALRDLLGRMSGEARRLDGEIAGIGVDFTSSTVLPATSDATPLALLDAFHRHPHAYVKLWKHHAAEPQAQAINAARPAFLTYYGGKTSAEWSLAKAWQTMDEAPQVWDATGRWIEGGDWIVWQLVGEEVRSACQAGYKAHWQPETGGYPDRGTLDRIHPGLGSWVDRLAPPHPVGTRAGGLLRRWAEASGIPEGTPVAVAVIDAHAAVPGIDVRDPGILVLVLGTSHCHMALSAHARPAPGIAGIVPDGILPGYYGYEAGQPATGDMLEWWVRTLAWAAGTPDEAIFDRLNEEASRLPDASGLVALDWWNGCRTPLMDAGLRGVLAGLTLRATPAEIYRALVEATAFGTRVVVETLEPGVGAIREVRATGGLSKVEFIMQVYADVLDREVRVSPTPHATARGAAVHGAMAAGRSVASPGTLRASPPRRAEAYDAPYRAYRDLFAHFSTAPWR